MGSFARLVEIVPMVLRGGGGPSRGAEIVPMVLRGGGGSLEGCRDSTIGTKGWWGVPRGVSR